MRRGDRTACRTGLAERARSTLRKVVHRPSVTPVEMRCGAHQIPAGFPRIRITNEAQAAGANWYIPVPPRSIQAACRGNSSSNLQRSLAASPSTRTPPSRYRTCQAIRAPRPQANESRGFSTPAIISRPPSGPMKMVQSDGCATMRCASAAVSMNLRAFSISPLTLGLSLGSAGA